MRITLFKYISREIWSIYVVSLLVFIFVIMATRIMSIADLLLNQNLHPLHLARLILCLLPHVLLFSMPIACLMCVLLAFIRLSTDNEIIALNSSGVGLYQIMPPVLFFSLINLVLAGFITFYADPFGNRAYRNVIYDIVESKTDLTIRERVFEEPVNNMFFYVNSFSSKDKTMKDLFVVDKRNKTSTIEIIAEKGRIISDKKSHIFTIHFTNGTILTLGNDSGSASPISFDSCELNINLRDLITGMIAREKEPKEMYFNELIAYLKKLDVNSFQRNLTEIRLFEMFSLPLAIFLLAVIGAPLGTHVRARGRTKGIVISFFVFFIYYTFLMFVSYLGENNVLTPAIGIWIPVIFLLIVCIYLIYITANDRPLFFKSLLHKHNKHKKHP